jgi:MoxR-like ATPase
VDYPSEEEENTIVTSTTSAYEWELDKVMGADEIIRLQKLARRVPVSDHVVNYAVRLARSTRPGENNSLPYIKNWVNWGAGPRASQYMILGAKTKAILDGRYTPSTEDVKAAAKPVLRHRIVTSFNAEADGVGTMEIIEKLLEDVKEE